MACWVKAPFIGLLIVPILVLTSVGSEPARAQAKLDAYYTATLLGLPIGHISWAVDLKENRFSSVATGSIAGLLRLFLDAQGSVAAEGRLSNGKPIPSKFQLKLLAGKWSDEVGIVFTGNRAKESVLPTSASPSADYVPIKDGDGVGASDPMTALLVYVGGAGATTVPQACERTVAIFDGHTRYNLRLAFDRFGTAHPIEGYQGQVVVCSAKFLPVAGYDPKHFLVTYLAAHHETEIWLAPLGSGQAGGADDTSNHGRLAAAPVEPAILDDRAAAPIAASGYAVQVTSERSEGRARAAFRALQARYPNQLSGRQPIIRRVDFGAAGIYYRALVGPFASAEKAAKMCSGLKAAGGDCIVQKN